MVRPFLFLLAGWIIAVISGVWLVAKVFLDLWSGAEALNANEGVLAKATNWLLGTPTWIPGVVLGLVVLLWALLTWHAISRPAAGFHIEGGGTAPSGSWARSGSLLPNTKSNALVISYEDKGCDQLQIFANGSARRTLLLKLENRGNGLLSDCRVFVRRTSPRITDRSILLKHATPLIPGQYIFFPIVTYMEKHADLPNVKDEVSVCEEYGGGFAPVPATISPPLKENPLLLTVEAIATECAPREAHFRVWVEQPTKRLRLKAA